MYAVVADSSKTKVLTDSDFKPIPLADIQEAKKFLQKVGFVKISMASMPSEYSTHIENKYIEYYVSLNDRKLLSIIGKKYKFEDLKKTKSISGSGEFDNLDVFMKSYSKSYNYVLVIIIIILILCIVVLIIRPEYFSIHRIKQKP